MDISYFQLFEDLCHQLAQDSHLRLVLSFSDFQTFECSQCAQCCRKPDRTPVSQAYLQEWRDTFKQMEPLRFADAFDPYPVASASEAANLGRHPDQDSCVFLDPDNLCWIQKNFGHAALPDVCQVFPRDQTQIGEHVLNQGLRSICRTVPKLWLSPPQLKWQLTPVSSPAAADESAYQQAHLLWLGFTLDTLTSAAPQTALFQLNLAWSQLLKDQQSLNTQSLKALQQVWPRFLSNEPELKPHLDQSQLDDFKAWLKPRIAGSALQTVFEQSGSGFATPASLPQPTPEQKVLANQFLRSYLMQQSLLSRESLHDGLNLLQQHLMMVEHLVFLQVLILCQLCQNNPLNPDCLATVTNQWGFFLEQRRRTLQNKEVGKMSLQSCLQNSRWFLTLNLGFA